MKRDQLERVVQRFPDEYLERCRELSPEDVVRYLESYRVVLGAAQHGSRSISLRVPESLLTAFKTKSKLYGVSYQRKIKSLMRDWLAESEDPAIS